MEETYNYDNDQRPVCGELKSESSIEDFLDSHKDCKFPPDLEYSIVLAKYGQREVKNTSSADHIFTMSETTTLPSEIKATVSTPEVIKAINQPNKADISSAPVLTAAIVGAISSAAMPALTSLLKTQLKKLFNTKKGNKAVEEKEEEKATDCKTHNLQCNTRSTKFATQISLLQTKISELEALKSKDSDVLSAGREDSELLERIEKIEKKLKKRK